LRWLFPKDKLCSAEKCLQKRQQTSFGQGQIEQKKSCGDMPDIKRNSLVVQASAMTQAVDFDELVGCGVVQFRPLPAISVICLKTFQTRNLFQTIPDSLSSHFFVMAAL
jgi:hypothetical protein